MEDSSLRFGFFLRLSSDLLSAIAGKQWFVSPSDSVAIIAANISCIPFFKDGRANGLSCSSWQQEQ